ncbi:hypothetical protein [Methylomonas albis]|uniref:Uncharacterized protein n=1 Tax=Methylomonas albis TaxID=1854563 RepID=A0ABR9D7W4_9GAMM|nr:hypothetical protein [Methylomonas albis]MBD9358373.1 hypothetical protein [Methylomonas albis]
MTLPTLTNHRGLIQRLTEGVLFGWLALASVVQLTEAYIGRIEVTKQP